MEVANDTLIKVETCPHCSVSTPNLRKVWADTEPHKGPIEANEYRLIGRYWGAYRCGHCASVVVTVSPPLYYANEHRNSVSNPKDRIHVIDSFPKSKSFDEAIPSRARSYLNQAKRSLHAPDGAVMLAASAVDAMLKAVGLADGSLYQRIEKATEEHILTESMAKWAHKVRLDANDVRHADEEREQFTKADAEQVLEFADAISQFMFVIPHKVQLGLENARRGKE